MIASIIMFVASCVATILAGVFVSQFSWLAPLLGFLTFLSVFLAVVMVLFIAAEFKNKWKK